MEIINLTQKELKKLIPFHVEEPAINSDANFYYRKKDKNILYKIFRTNSSKLLSEKKQIIEELIAAKEEINIPELVLPENIITIDNGFKGITINKINGCNLSLFLSSKGCPIRVKIGLLKELGKLLQRIHQVNPTLNLAFGDVHGDNFMCSGEKLYAVDTDCMKIHHNKARASYYIRLNSWINEISKYELDDSDFVDISKDTDIFCFIMMILDVIANEKIYLLTLDEYKRYLDYLNTLGFDTNLLNAFASVFNPNISNINPTIYLDSVITSKNGAYSLYKC